MYYDAIPSHLISRDRYKEFITWLKSIPISNRDKTRVFIAWTKEVGYEYTKKDIEIIKR